MKFDSLFLRRDGASSRRSSREEPRFGGLRGGLPALPEPGDSVAPLSTPMAPQSRNGRGRASLRIDPRRMSPRQLADWAHEMYLCRMLSWDEYCMAGFPAELHPHYNRTVGALTGNLAQPDAPRNMLRVWEERVAFAHRYNDPEDPEVLRAEKLLTLLKQSVPKPV
jgi:hypothetical protein